MVVIRSLRPQLVPFTLHRFGNNALRVSFLNIKWRLMTPMPPFMWKEVAKLAVG